TRFGLGRRFLPDSTLPRTKAWPRPSRSSATGSADVPLRMYPVEELAQLSTAQRRFSMLLLGMFAVLAMTLAVVGIYGLMSYSVSQRSHEIGLRMALGSETSRVIRMVIREGLALSGLGVAMGIGYAIAMTRVMSGLLFGIAPTDPLTYAALS